MLSSTDISAMFAAQQGQFAQTASFSQQISSNMGVAAPNQSLGQWGIPQSQSRPPPYFPNVQPPPQAYSYAPRGMETGTAGNRFASGVMSAAGGLSTLAGVGMGFTKLAPLVDPIAGAMTGFGAAGVGGAMAGAALPLALAYGASKAVGSVIQGGQQYAATSQMLGQNFGFMNPQSRTGFGFTRNDALGISQQMRQMSHIPEMMTSMEELNRLTPMLKSAGVFQGTRDAAEFNKRFKDSIRTLRDMSKVLGSTMEEAAEFFQQSRAAGFTTRTSQLQNVLNARLTSAATGMSMPQVMQMQMGGAQMAQQMGIRRGVGAKAVTNMAQMLQQGVDSGGLDQTLLEDITGMQGSEAVGAAAQQLTGTMTNLARGTSFGKLAMLSLAEFDEKGKYKGISKERATRLQRGELGADEMKKIVQGFSREQKISATARSGTMAAEFAGQTGLAGMGSMVRGVMGERGYSEEAMTHVLVNKMGLSETTADAIMQMAGQDFDPSQTQGMADRLARQAATRERTDPKAIWQKMKTRIHSSTLGKLEEVGEKLTHGLSQWFDKTVDDFFERYSVSMSKEGAAKLERAFTSTGQQDIGAMMTDASSVRGMFGQGKIDTRRSWGQFGKDVLAGASPITAFGTGAVGRNLEALRDSELASSLMGGRSERMQYLKTRDRMLGEGGTTGLTDEAADRAMRVRAQELRGIGEGAGLNTDLIVGGLAARASAAGKNVFDMTGAQKGEALRGQVAEAMGGRMFSEKSMLERMATVAGGLGPMGNVKGAYHAAMAGEWGQAAKAMVPVFGALQSTEDLTNQIKSGMTIAEAGEQGTKAALRGLGASEDQANQIYEKIKDKGEMSLMEAGSQILGVKSGVDSSALFSMSVAERSKALTEAEEGLVSAVGAERAAVLKSNPKMARLFRDMDGENGAKIQAAMGKAAKGDIDGALSDLSEYGISASDLHAAAGIYGSMKGEKGQSIKDAIGKYTSMQAYNDLAMHADSVSDTAANVSNKELKGSLQAYAETVRKGGDRDAAVARLQGSFKSVLAQLDDPGLAPDKREKLLAETGELRSSFERASGIGKGLRGGGPVSAKTLAAKLGMKESDAAFKEIAQSVGLAGGEKRQLSEEAIKKIETKAVEMGVGKTITAKGKEEIAGEKDQQLLDTLKNINKTIDMNTTVIASATGIDKDKLTKSLGEKATEAAKETKNSKKPGEN